MEIWTPKYSNKDYEIKNKEKLLSDYLGVEKYKINLKTFSESELTIERQILLRPPNASVLLYKPNTDEVALIEQFRPGAMNEGSPWLLELVAGLIEEGESAEESAIRETQEEAGCKIEKLIHICDYLNSPGISNEKSIVFCGLINECNPGHIHGNENEGEDIKLHVFSAQDAFTLVEQGRILNVSTIVALSWLQINHKKIQEESI